jgi:hypothetical protein
MLSRRRSRPGNPSTGLLRHPTPHLHLPPHRPAFTIAATLCSVLAALLCGSGPSSAASFQIISDQRSTVSSATLCLAVDGDKPLVASPADKIILPKGGAPTALPGTFYPVVVAACDKPDVKLPMQWTMTDIRELRVMVGGKSLCVSVRPITSFTPLLDPFLRAFHAFDDKTPFAYLARDLKPGGVVNARRLRRTPDLVAGDCGRPDSVDFWVFDDLTGTISGPSGWDDQSEHVRTCVTMHGDWAFSPPKHDAGMPVSAADCPELRAYSRSGIFAHQRWRLSAGTDALPTYLAPDPKHYFDGKAGLPIAGPMGRRLTADFPGKLAVTSNCDGRTQQDWIDSGGTIRLGPAGCSRSMHTARGGCGSV